MARVPVQGGSGFIDIPTGSGPVTRLYVQGGPGWVEFSGSTGGGGVTLVSIAVTPANPPMTIGATQQMTATGTYSDGSTLNITSAVTWASSNAAAMTISNGSGGGLLTGVNTGTSTISATLGAVSGSTTATISSVLARTSFPLPSQGTNLFGSAFGYFLPIFVPSDVASLKLRAGNRIYGAILNFDVTEPQVAVYKSDGTGVPTGASLHTEAMTFPGDGSMVSSGSANITRGTDGKVVPAWSIPAAGGTVGYDPSNNIGNSATGSTVDPIPGTLTPNVSTFFWVDLEYLTSKRRVTAIGDSIMSGYNGTGFPNTAWQLIQQAGNYSVNANGTSAIKMAVYADPVTYPRQWDEMLLDSASSFVIQLGTNDIPDGAAAMKTRLLAIIAKAQSLGVTDIVAWTLPPAAAYIASDANRLAYNADLLAHFASYGIRAVYNAAAAQNAGGLASNSDPTVLYAPYDTGDGTHPNAAGNLQIKAGWVALGF